MTFENTVWYDNAKIYDSNNNLLLNALRGQENKFILPDNGVIFITMYLLVSVDGVETYGAPTGESFVYKYTIPNGTKTIGLIEGEPS